MNIENLYNNTWCFTSKESPQVGHSLVHNLIENSSYIIHLLNVIIFLIASLVRLLQCSTTASFKQNQNVFYQLTNHENILGMWMSAH